MASIPPGSQDEAAQGFQLSAIPLPFLELSHLLKSATPGYVASDLSLPVSPTAYHSNASIAQIVSDIAPRPLPVQYSEHTAEEVAQKFVPIERFPERDQSRPRLGGMVGQPSESQSEMINGRSDNTNDVAAGARVRFGGVNEHDTNEIAVAPKAASEPQSILKPGPMFSPVDFAALSASFSDSGSEGLSEYDDESDAGSVSDEDSGSETESTSESAEEQMDPRYRKKKQKLFLYGLTTEEEEAEMQSEIDMHDEGVEEEGANQAVRQELIHETDSGRLESATLADYEDMDGLLVTLDRYLKKNRASRAAHAPPVPDPIAVLKHVKTKEAPSWAQEASELAVESDPEIVESQPLGAMLQKVSENKDGATLGEGAAPDDKVHMLLAKLTEANVKKITTRIYIEDAKSFKTLLLTSLMSADQIIHEVVTKFRQEESPNWTLFELCNDLSVERPLRDWEIVTDVISAWESGTSVNAIVMKKYGYRDTVSANSIAGKYPRVQGWMYMETKPGKWQRRFFVLREANLYHYKDAKQSGAESLFCGFSNFDVYTLSQRRRKTPTQFAFALRSTDSISMFENKQDYVRFLCVEKEERLFDWVLAIRLAKSEKTFADFPEIFEDYHEIPAKASQRRHGDTNAAVSSANKKPAGTLIDQNELNKGDGVLPPTPNLRREGSRSRRSPAAPKTLISAVPSSHQKLPSHRPPRPLVSRRTAESPSGSDDDEEPLLVRQMRQTSAAAGDDEGLLFAEREGFVGSRRPSRQETDREDPTSQSERDDAAYHAKRKPRTRRHTNDEPPSHFERDLDPHSMRRPPGAVRSTRSRGMDEVGEDVNRRPSAHSSSSHGVSENRRRGSNLEAPSRRGGDAEHRERRTHREHRSTSGKDPERRRERHRDHGGRDVDQRDPQRERGEKGGDPEREREREHLARAKRRELERQHRERDKAMAPRDSEVRREHRREREIRRREHHHPQPHELRENEGRELDRLRGGDNGDQPLRRHRTTPSRGSAPSDKPNGSTSTTLVDRIDDIAAGNSGAAAAATRPLHRSRTLRESGSKRSGAPAGPLIDISDSPNCRRCGCSEFKPGRGTTCSNCYHVHKES